ncbi:hypothetical protein Sjap_015538 [Stephania japonica]|uniref:Uncharacterized protein n=1 Tax=Stephania japonica TaxID=461633 RepID=A0AAP0NU22_9MAGN
MGKSPLCQGSKSTANAPWVALWRFTFTAPLAVPDPKPLWLGFSTPRLIGRRRGIDREGEIEERRATIHGERGLDVEAKSRVVTVCALKRRLCQQETSVPMRDDCAYKGRL